MSAVVAVLTGRVLDLEAGELRAGHSVALGDDGRIAAVGPRDEVVTSLGDVPEVDLGDAVLAPGLINMHVHLGLALPGDEGDKVRSDGPAGMALTMAGEAQRTLQAGVTTVRLVGESDYLEMPLRRAIDAGTLPGPRIRTAGHALCCTGGHGHDSDAMEADGADGFRHATRDQLKHGADHIKVCISGGIAGEHEGIDTPQLSDDEMRAVIETAHDWGKQVTAHCGPSPVAERAIGLGLDGIEHGYQLTPELCALMAERGTWLCPTILVTRCESFMRDRGVPEWMLERSLEAGERHWQSLLNAVEARVPMVVGTDLPPHVLVDGATATVREMELMGEAGLTPLQVLRAAGPEAARWLGMDGVGALAEGAYADLVVLDGDPLDDLAALRGIHAVVKGGAVVRDDRGVLRDLAPTAGAPR